ncbi:Alpha/Beta hydrolase protein [Stachybotrys elegans]|uniref:1-alkyl-2-acetylglycerophosphocholine esterase n=1 Tax=Stachybotrys elegans TaxID=80388 RepID=A0A8K0T2M4_9HYPO|nr:Alpha/Beta hydrolase protein [Stachybotrys elegans]
MLPAPMGEYPVGKTQFIVPHTTYNDPVAPPEWNGTGSFVLASMFYPTVSSSCSNRTMRYVDEHLARYYEARYDLPAGIMSRVRAPIAPEAPHRPKADREALPTVLLSAGASNPCVLDSVLAMDLASMGYTVICLDHPGEVPYLQLPSGEGIAGIPFDETWDSAYDIYTNRVPDTLALLDFLPSFAAENALPINTSCYVAVGHSIGGNAGVASVAYAESVVGGINLDGSMVGDNTTNIEGPFMIMAGEGHNTTTDPSWDAFLGLQTGEWQLLTVEGTRHSDFVDLTVLAEVLGVGKAHMRLGPLDGYRMREITTIFVKAFFDSIMGSGGGLLDGPLPTDEWPEVQRTKAST